MDLFYTPPECIDLRAGMLVVEGEEFFHIVRVLRRREGDSIVVTDGCGLSVDGVIAAVGKGSLSASISSVRRIDPPSTRVTVAISLLKSAQRFDFFLEKAAELGVTAIIPMVTSRTVSQPRGEKIHRKAERWKKVLIAASQQSKRYYLPDISEPRSFSEVLSLEGYDEKLIPYESSIQSPAVSPAGKNVLFVIGGEGGFTEIEVQQARQAGFSDISFGTSILRAETAGIFAVAMVRAEMLSHPNQY